MQRRVFLAFAVLLCLPVAAQSAAINVGSHLLLPNTPNQQVPIFVTGTELVNGVDLLATVGNVASPSNVLSPAADHSPTITNADIIGAAGFPATILTGQAGVPTNPQPATATSRTVWYGDTTATLNFTALDNGVFGTLVFDTTGIFAGALQKTWALRLGQGNSVDIGTGSTSDLGTNDVGDPFVPMIVDGNVFIAAAIIPEPSSIVLALFAAAGLADVAICRRRSA
jgi:hypothetical protein